MLKTFWSKITNPIYLRGFDLGHASGKEEGHHQGLLEGVAIGERKGASLYEAALTGMREIIRARRGETPQSSPVAAVTYLINSLERAEQDKDRIATFAWSLISEFTPPERINEVSNKMKSIVAVRF